MSPDGGAEALTGMFPASDDTPLSIRAGGVGASGAVPGSDERMVLASGGFGGAVRLWDPTTGIAIGNPFNLSHQQGLRF
jgi:hypothetical protein